MGKEPMRIAVLTSGGDAPGMNAAVRAVVRTALYKGLVPYGVERGYAGLIEGKIRELNASSVGGIINRGGTVLRTARSEEFKTPEGRRSAADALRAHGIETLVVIGGDGSYRGAADLSNEHSDIRTIGLPGTIDNDIGGTDYTIGYDTAVNTAVEAIDKIRDTADSHDRVFVVEVMGRLKGFIALAVGISGGAEYVVIPTHKYDPLPIAKRIKDGYARGKKSCILVVAEGAARGIAVAADIADITGFETRTVVLGHVQRGGTPSAFDRILASRLGARAVTAAIEGASKVMVGIRADEVVVVAIEEAWAEERAVDEELLELAAMLSI
jgi:6-phosphofructokinase 1